jgi:hypothetical protein
MMAAADVEEMSEDEQRKAAKDALGVDSDA